MEHEPELEAKMRSESNSALLLFSDLRGFTTFSEDAKPAEVVARLNEYFDAMVTVITANGGTVDQFMGDAVMAVFRRVIPMPNAATAALDAALGMREALKVLNRGWARAR